MKIKWDDKEFIFEFDEIDVAQAMVIFTHCGLTLNQLNDGLYQEMDPRAIKAAYWLMHEQTKDAPTVDIDRVNFKAVRFMEAIIAGIQEERAAAKAKAEAEEAAKVRPGKETPKE